MPDDLTYPLASSLVAAALDALSAQGIRGAAAVVDAGGHLVAFGRADGASFLSADVTRRKAVTAAALGLPSRAVAGIAQAEPAAAADLMRQPDLCGVPVRVGGRLVGGLGVAGGRSEQDNAAAEAALAAVLPAPVVEGG